MWGSCGLFRMKVASASVLRKWIVVPRFPEARQYSLDDFDVSYIPDVRRMEFVPVRPLCYTTCGTDGGSYGRADAVVFGLISRRGATIQRTICVKLPGLFGVQYRRR